MSLKTYSNDVHETARDAGSTEKSLRNRTIRAGIEKFRYVPCGFWDGIVFRTTRMKSDVAGRNAVSVFIESANPGSPPCPFRLQPSESMAPVGLCYTADSKDKKTRSLSIDAGFRKVVSELPARHWCKSEDRANFDFRRIFFRS